MTIEETTIRGAYLAFNVRDVDGALALMTENVSWPKASEGGNICGKQGVRDYWTRQWSAFDPHVEPMIITKEADGTFRVRVHQVVKSLGGDILSDSEVFHIFTLESGIVAAMNLGDEAGPDDRPSAAFAHSVLK